MANEKAPFRVRLASFIAGSKNKDYVPSLTVSDLFSSTSGLKSYDSKKDQLEALTGWVYAANSAIIEPTAAVEFVLNRRKKDGDLEKVTSGPELEILELFKAPNLAHTGEQMMQLHYTYLNATGESYIHMRGLDGKPFQPAPKQLPAALDIFPTHQLDFKLGETFSQSLVRMGATVYPITSFIRTINPDPSNPYFGRSIVRAASAAIDTDNQMKDWNRSVFANSARPGLIFSTNEALSNDSYNRWKQQFDDDHGGTENAFKPLLVEGGDAKPFMLNQQDLDFLESRKFSRDEILAMFKVSPGMVGSVENVNRANLDAGFYINAMINVLPRVRQFVKQVNATLVSVYDPSLELGYVNPVPEDQEAKLAYAKAAAGNTAWLTVDEIRDIYGEKALDGDTGQHVMVPSLVTTLDQAIQEKPDPVAPLDPNAPDPKADDPKPKDPKKAEGKKDLAATLAGVKKKNLRLKRAMNLAKRR